MTRPSLIPGGVTVEGELSGKGDLVVLGRVLGDITIDGLLIIEEGGAVRGAVSASSVVVRGALAGDAIGQESVRVEATAQVVGDLRAPRVKVADGAHVKGRVQIGAEAGLSRRAVVHAPALAQPAAAVARPALAPALAPAPGHVATPAPVTAVAPVAVPASTTVGPRVRRARLITPASDASPAPAPASFVRPPLTMPRLTRVAAERR
ncbi:MAG: polymer-forming cytoskeletal protein [Myxococcales bacterium]|nr:polymer-forming cytoskeletal protein [Myxococcales bacterium]MCB9627496.1 polymer-forming cytoskeletal protein [Sandaracinaceae bacterium]